MLSKMISSHVRISYHFYQFVTTLFITNFYIIKLCIRYVKFSGTWSGSKNKKNVSHIWWYDFNPHLWCRFWYNFCPLTAHKFGGVWSKHVWIFFGKSLAIFRKFMFGNVCLAFRQRLENLCKSPEISGIFGK